MTWLDYMLLYNPLIKKEEAEYILWEETCYPCGDIKMVAKQVRRAIRSHLNHIQRCDACLSMKPYHSKNCPNKIIGESL